MTRKEIEQALENGGFACYEARRTSSSYGYGEMEVLIEEHMTSIYLGHLELGVCTALSYRNDELSEVKIESHPCFEGLKIMTIETKAGESVFCFK